MKTLYVLRHAKSSWDYPELPDFERPLNKRGEKAAPFIGQIMREEDLLPEFILSSPAQRAKQTANLVKDSANLDAEISLDQRIYGASANSLLHIVSEIDDTYESAMIVGHNPGFEGLVGVLISSYERMPTAALAVIEFEIDKWSEIGNEIGKLAELLRPKEQKKIRKKR